LQALSAIVTALAIAFSSGWKLTLVVLCFVPLLMLNGILYGRTQGKARQSKDKDSFVEQGGQVLNKLRYFMYL
jgi:ABC-type multidrug transport system fused ATPase/permease subunit